MIIVLCFLLLICVPGVGLGSQGVEFDLFESSEFAPIRGERFPIPVKMNLEVAFEIRIYSSDGDLVRILTHPGSFKPGTGVLEWDGRDSEGIIVPDEAYIPVISGHLKSGSTFVSDPRATSGGEIVEDVKTHITADRGISYSLPAASRVLIRVGMKDGPMLRTLESWAPKGPGKNVQRWNGFDNDQLVDLRTDPRLAVLVTAFKLPDRVMITTGNDKVSYREYRLSKGWSETSDVKPDAMKLQRNGRPISRAYYLPRWKHREPRLSALSVEGVGIASDRVPMIKGPVPIKVEMHQEDRWLMQESLYEVAFFVDGEFVSEEEHGYMPLTWLWNPGGISKGRHMLTVNASGFDGRVGVKSILFDVP
jgi:hypothetical protein